MAEDPVSDRLIISGTSLARPASPGSALGNASGPVDGSSSSRPRPSGMDLLRRTSEVCWRVLIVGVTLAVAVWLLRQVWPVVVSVVVAAMAATALGPLVTRLQRRGVPRWAATVVVFVLALGTVAGILGGATASLSEQARSISDELNRSTEEVRDWATGDPLNINPTDFDNAEAGLRRQFEDFSSSAQLLSAAQIALTVLTGILLSLVLLFFFLKDGPLMARWSLGLFPPARQTTVQRVAQRARKALQGYIRGTLVIGVVESLFVGILLAAMGVPQFLPLAAFTFMAAFFPIVGAIAAGTLAVLITLVETDFTKTLIVAVAIVALQQIDGDLLQPLVMGGAVRLHPVVILLSLTAGGLVAGITGAFLAVPLTAVVSAAANELRQIRRESAIDLPDGVAPP